VCLGCEATKGNEDKRNDDSHPSRNERDLSIGERGGGGGEKGWGVGFVGWGLVKSGKKKKHKKNDVFDSKRARGGTGSPIMHLKALIKRRNLGWLRGGGFHSLTSLKG